MGLVEKGTVKVKGKDYKLVAKRVDEFRLKFKGYGIDTKIIDLGLESGVVVIEAKIKNPENQVVGSGHAEEKRNSSQINKTSALENCETSAIGRALASMGLGGGVYASADELANALTQQNIQASSIKESKKETKKEKTTFEKAKEIFKPKKISEAEKDEIARNFNSLVKAYGYKLENEGAVAIEGILKICKIHTEANRGGRDELMTLPFERKQELIPILKKAI